MSITSELQSAQIKSFMFNPHESAPSPPYTICSKSSNDDDNMDASLLMSQDYVQPLIPSELSALVHQVLDKENVSCLRYLSAKKLIHFQKRFQAAFVPTSFPDLPATSYPLQSRFSTYPVSPINSSGSSQAILSYTSGASSFVQARLADHTQREEKLAQIRLAKWASDLQRCLHNERTQYESISRGERAVWLTQRLAECVGNGSLIPLRGSSTDTPSPSGKATQAMKSRPMDHSAYYSYMNVRDPLGLLGWNETMRKRGWIAIQVVGSFGVLGAMAIWIARSWSNSSDAYAGWNFGRWIGKA